MSTNNSPIPVTLSDTDQNINGMAQIPVSTRGNHKFVCSTKNGRSPIRRKKLSKQASWNTMSAITTWNKFNNSLEKLDRVSWKKEDKIRFGGAIELHPIKVNQTMLLNILKEIFEQMKKKGLVATWTK